MKDKTKKTLKEKVINFLSWLKEECKDWRTFVILICVIIVMYFPVWGGYLMYFIFKWNWSLVMANIMLAFWAGPITPFFPIAIAITLAIKRIIRIYKKRKLLKNIKMKSRRKNK